MTTPYPHTVNNGSGELLTFLRLVPTEAGDRLELEGYALPNVGVPMHIHHRQEEGFSVLDGTMGYQLADGPEQFLRPGETAVFPAGVPHRWWNAGTTRLHTTGWLLPAENGEYFLTELFESRKRSGNGRPGLFDVAFLMTRYRSEFDMLAIPAAIKAFGFPILLAIGRLLGKYRRFAGAPEPVMPAA